MPLNISIAHVSASDNSSLEVSPSSSAPSVDSWDSYLPGKTSTKPPSLPPVLPHKGQHPGFRLIEHSSRDSILDALFPPVGVGVARELAIRQSGDIVKLKEDDGLIHGQALESIRINSERLARELEIITHHPFRTGLVVRPFKVLLCFEAEIRARLRVLEALIELRALGGVGPENGDGIGETDDRTARDGGREEVHTVRAVREMKLAFRGLRDDHTIGGKDENIGVEGQRGVSRVEKGGVRVAEPGDDSITSHGGSACTEVEVQTRGRIAGPEQERDELVITSSKDHSTIHDEGAKGGDQGGAGGAKLKQWEGETAYEGSGGGHAIDLGKPKSSRPSSEGILLSPEATDRDLTSVEKSISHEGAYVKPQGNGKKGKNAILPHSPRPYIAGEQLQLGVSPNPDSIDTKFSRLDWGISSTGARGFGSTTPPPTGANEATADWDWGRAAGKKDKRGPPPRSTFGDIAEENQLGNVRNANARDQETGVVWTAPISEEGEAKGAPIIEDRPQPEISIEEAKSTLSEDGQDLRGTFGIQKSKESSVTGKNDEPFGVPLPPPALEDHSDVTIDDDWGARDEKNRISKRLPEEEEKASRTEYRVVEQELANVDKTRRVGWGTPKKGTSEKRIVTEENSTPKAESQESVAKPELDPAVTEDLGRCDWTSEGDGENERRGITRGAEYLSALIKQNNKPMSMRSLGSPSVGESIRGSDNQTLNVSFGETSVPGMGHLGAMSESTHYHEPGSSAFKGRIADPQVMSAEHLRCLVEFMDERLKSDLETYRKAKAHTLQEITFSDLWMIFEVGDIVLSAKPGIRAFRVFGVEQIEPHYRALPPPPPSSRLPRHHESSRSPLSIAHSFRRTNARSASVSKQTTAGGDTDNDVGSFVIHCVNLDFDGEKYGPVHRMITIPGYQGSKSIPSLPIFPLKFLRNSDEVESKLLERGKRYVNLARTTFKQHSGLSLHPFYGREKLESRVIIDPIIGYKGGTFARPKFHEIHPIQRKSPNNYATTGEIINSDEWVDQECNEAFFSRYSSILKTSSDGDRLERDGLILLPAWILAFVLRYHEWHFLNIDFISDLKERNDDFEHLVLSRGYEDLLRANVANHSRKVKSESGEDVAKVEPLDGKGDGVVILLHGPPGTGKSTTAGGVILDIFGSVRTNLGFQSAQQTTLDVHYAMSPTLAGSPVSYLKILYTRAYEWGCVVLFDEIDLFIRKTKELSEMEDWEKAFFQFLRGYPGIIFLTARNVDSLGEEWRSKVDVTLHFPPLSQELSIRLWGILLDQATEGLKVDREDIINFAKMHYRLFRSDRSWNGKEIRNAFERAIALAKYDVKSGKSSRLILTSDHFERVHPLVRVYERKDYVRYNIRAIFYAAWCKWRTVRDRRGLTGNLKQPNLPSGEDKAGKFWSIARHLRLVGRPLANNIKRIEWTCHCGHQSYDDYEEFDPDHLNGFVEELLREGSVRLASKSDFSYGVLKEVGMFLNNSVWSIRRLLDWCTSAQQNGQRQKISGHTGEQARSGYLQHNDSHNSPVASQQQNKILPRSGRDIPRVETSPYTAPSGYVVFVSPIFLLLCIDSGRWMTKLKQPELTLLTSDQELFQELRTQYYNERGLLRRTFSVKALRSIRFVQFELRPQDLVDCMVKDQFPPDSTSSYQFHPKPPKCLPPIGEKWMMHLFLCSSATSGCICLKQFPKKLHRPLGLEGDSDENMGWGIYFEEGVHVPLIWTIALALVMVASTTFLVCWGLLKHDLNSATEVAAWIMAPLALGVGTLQAWIMVS